MRKVEAFVKDGGEVMLCHDPNGHPYDLDAELEARS
jgi:hypothetical protein